MQGKCSLNPGLLGKEVDTQSDLYLSLKIGTGRASKFHCRV